MRLSIKGDYGVRAMLDLAERYGQGPIQSESIAARQEISESYLDQLLSLLRRAGLVRSTRGPHGGHELARPAAEITLTQILTALEGEFLPTGPQSGFELPSVKVQQELWERVRAAMESILNEMTLQALLDRQRALATPNRYYI